MWRYVLGAAASLLLIGAGWLMLSGDGVNRGAAHASGTIPVVAPAEAQSPTDEAPVVLPEAPERTREQKRFDRYDKDRDAKITRDEYLLSRRKAFAKLDLNGDGRLSFEEWSAKTVKRFSDADTDRSGTLTAPEFATTKPKRKARAACACPSPARDED